MRNGGDVGHVFLNVCRTAEVGPVEGHDSLCCGIGDGVSLLDVGAEVAVTPEDTRMKREIQVKNSRKRRLRAYFSWLGLLTTSQWLEITRDWELS